MIQGIKNQKNNIIFYVLLVVFTLIMTYISFGKGFRFWAYPTLSGDGFSFMAIVKGIEENGMMEYFFNPRLGAPDGSSIVDSPGCGFFTTFYIYIISLFFNGVPKITQLYYWATFATDAIGMAVLLKKIKVGNVPAFIMSFLFAIAPYHFYRNIMHGALVDYACIPIAIYLALYVVGYIEENKIIISLMAIFLGLSFGYYYSFGLILLVIAFIVGFIRSEEKKQAIKKVWVIIVVLCTVVATLLPKVIYTMMNGSTQAMERGWFEQEGFGLKIIQLLLPVSYTKIGWMKDIVDEYGTYGSTINENMYASLGIIGSIGFIALCVAFFISISKKNKTTDSKWKLIDFTFVLTLSMVLFGTIGGFGEIFNWAVTSQIRCQNRVSIVISALSAMMVAILLHQLFQWKKAVAVIASTMVLCLGTYDQLNVSGNYWQDALVTQQQEYEAYYAKVEESLPEGAMVYQLPYMDYPEAGMVNNIPDYSLFVGYMFTNDLKWSYGGIKGRDTTAKELFVDDGMSYRFLQTIKEAGFSAVYINTDGYADEGTDILTFYQSLGLKPIVSIDNKTYVYDITNLEIPEEYLTPGYAALRILSLECQVEVTDDELISMAKGIKKNKTSDIDTVYEWLMNLDDFKALSQYEYTRFLALKFLHVEPDESTLSSWWSEFENGADRLTLFENVLKSDEFKELYGFN